MTWIDLFQLFAIFALSGAIACFIAMMIIDILGEK